MTAVEWLADEIIMLEEKLRLEEININDFMDAKDELVSKVLEMEKEQKIELLKSLVYSVCIGDDVEDVEEWLKEHELNKSE
jgi:hypothetical protein